MRITFWGVRGSIPSPLAASDIKNKIIAALKRAVPDDLNSPESIARYVEALPFSIRGTIGGNTSCMEITEGNTEIIIDAGTGLRKLGIELLQKEFALGKGKAHILLSHFHWDHIQGIPFFLPIHIPGNRFLIYSPKNNSRDVFELQQNPNNFPVRFHDFPAEVEFITLDRNGSLNIDGIKVKWIELNHPGGSYAYRLEGPTGSIVYATDAEYEGLSKEDVNQYLKFFSGCDILVFDSMFTPEVAAKCKGWGHSTANMGLQIAVQAHVRKLVLYHHEPCCDDAMLEKLREAIQETASKMCQNGLEVITAFESLSLTL